MIVTETVRVVETYIVRSGRNLRRDMEKMVVDRGEGRISPWFYRCVYCPFDDIKGIIKPSINEKGVFRYSIETSKGTYTAHDQIHQQVQDIIRDALDHLNRVTL